MCQGEAVAASVPLDGTWRLSAVCIPGGGVQHGFAGDAEPPQVRCRFRAWQDARVPGCVQETLWRAGELPDPYLGDNLDHWRWVEDREWWYRRSFTLPPGFPDGRLRLVCDGLDTCAAVFLNGELIAEHANAFRPLEVEVAGRLRRDRANVLAIRLQPPHWHSRFHPGDGTSGFPDPHRVHTRKPQYAFGWDIAPRLMAVGIPGAVRLEAYDEVELTAANVRTRALDADGAEVELVLACRNHGAAAIAVTVAAELAGRPLCAAITLPPGASEHALPVRLPGIAPWQPRGLGEPVLHHARVALRHAGGEIASAFPFGVRTVALVQRPQADGGTSFIVAVNGTELFIKGLNWTPAEALPTLIDDARIRRLVDLADGCHVNLLRVWGGGFYERELFYRLCDERGILVWQDCMLGCGQYPQDDAFVAEVGREVAHQFTRLRGHPCLALLAGDNENDCFHHYAGSDAHRRCRLTRGVIQQAAARLCPELPYLPSSPLSPTNPDPLCPLEGDNHLWDHEAPHDRPPYTTDRSRFMSEMGRLSLPPLEVVRRCIPPGQELPLTSPAWRFHAADSERVGFGERMQILLDCLRAGGHAIPGDLPGLIDLSQRVQAEALVHWARQYHASPVCAGIILWNLCDCWPQMSDAIVAYPDLPKPAYHALAAAYAAIPSRLADRRV